MLTTKEITRIAEAVAKRLAGLEDLWNTKKAAEYMGVKPAWLTRHAEIPRQKRGKMLFFRKSDLDRWIMDENRKVAASRNECRE